MEDNRSTIRLNADDNVVIALKDLDTVNETRKNRSGTAMSVSAGHKIAAKKIPKGGLIRKYGQIIGVASKDINPGEHVHTHNMKIGKSSRSAEIETDIKPVNCFSNSQQAKFKGIVRSDGRIATRNYVGVLPSVACSASVCRYITDALSPKILEAYPNVDGVVGLTHTGGCGMSPHSPGFENLQRCLAGYANHPNFWGVLYIGLGCEVNQLELIFDNPNLSSSAKLRTISIQEVGGTEATIKLGIEMLSEMLPEANQAKREAVPASHLILGLECGGSDAFSGITANPALGAAADLVVQNGGTVILSETTEIYGAEQLLIQRAANQKVADKLMSLIHWWEEYTRINGATINNNPTPGNKAGGLTTILEKSLGAVAKAGSTPLMEVYRYAEEVTAKGLVFMDTPGYDLASVTGMVAGGANMICFTTGCGTVLGVKPVPVIKLASNTEMFLRLSADMDMDCGGIIYRKQSIEEAGEAIFQSILDTASGQKTKSEVFGYGDNEFVPWQIGAVL